jgi:spore coat protein U-like protein
VALFAVALIILTTQRAPQVHAASCCGGGPGSTAIISGDESLRTKLTIGFKQSSGKTLNFGQSALATNSDYISLGIVDIAYKLSEKWQVALGLGWSQTTSNRLGLKDSKISAGYALYQNYLYSPWRPDIYLSLGMVLPTGTSFYTDRSAATDDELLKGSVSVLLTKVHVDWDWSVNLGFQKSKQGDFYGSDLKLDRGDAWFIDFLIGTSPRFAPKWHLSLGQGFEYTAPSTINRQGEDSQTSLSSIVFPITLAAAYAFDEQLAVSLGYSNRKLFKSQNSDLAETLNLTFSFRRL